jgi:hypothetical protein
MELWGNSSSGLPANAANRGGRNACGNNRGCGGANHGQGLGNDFSNNPRQGNSGGRGNFGRGGRGSGSTSRPRCQVCYKVGHTTERCWHRFEEDFAPKEKHVAAAMGGAYNVDTNWYTDTGATDHITSELDKLAVREKYHGADQIHTASGSGMPIIGQSTIHTPDRNLQLCDILHVLSTKKNLVSVHKLACDNNVFLEFHPNFFLIKDRDTKATLLEGPCRKGLYPLPPMTGAKQAFGVNKVSFDRWHSRLGHTSISIVEKVLRTYKLPYVVDSNKDSLCDACQQAKSHQLPYPKSTSISSHPLELVFSDVWGPAPDSVGRYKYYVSFIDDFSKFTWIYLLKFESEVF